MSSQAVLDPPQASTVYPTLSIIVSRMTLDDVPAVMAIERISFPRPWPERAYHYELIENPNAYFVVARVREHKMVENEVIGSYASQWQKLAQLLRLQRRPALQASRVTVVGFAGMWMYLDEAHIATIATHPEWRGRGIGELILINLMREAQRRNATNVTLEVRVSNVVAQNLYRKYGFEKVGYRNSYYQDNREDALMMTVTNFTEPSYRARLDRLEHNLRVHVSTRPTSVGVCRLR